MTEKLKTDKQLNRSLNEMLKRVERRLDDLQSNMDKEVAKYRTQLHNKFGKDIKSLKQEFALLDERQLVQKMNLHGRMIDNHQHIVQASIQRTLAGSEVAFYLRSVHAPQEKQLTFMRAYWYCVENWSDQEWIATNHLSVDMLLGKIVKAYRERIAA